MTFASLTRLCGKGGTLPAGGVKVSVGAGSGSKEVGVCDDVTDLNKLGRSYLPLSTQVFPPSGPDLGS